MAPAAIPASRNDTSSHNAVPAHRNTTPSASDCIGSPSFNRPVRYAAGRPIAEDVRLATHLPQGDAGTEIPKLISEFKIDLLIMGTVARSGISGLVIGNTAETILDQVTCSVLAVKPFGFVSDVTLND